MSKTRTGALVVLVLLLGVFAADRWVRRGATPPSGVRDLHSFLKWHPLPQRFHVLKKEGRDYLVVVGRPFAVLPSGPTAYVFDKSGRLLEWTADAHADKPFQERWPVEPGGRELKNATAEQWVTPGKARHNP